MTSLRQPFHYWMIDQICLHDALLFNRLDVYLSSPVIIPLHFDAATVPRIRGAMPLASASKITPNRTIFGIWSSCGGPMSIGRTPTLAIIAKKGN